MPSKDLSHISAVLTAKHIDGVEVDGPASAVDGAAVVFDGVTGKKVKALTAATHITDASTAASLNATFNHTEAETALNALGTKINTILDALEAAKIVAAS